MKLAKSRHWALTLVFVLVAATAFAQGRRGGDRGGQRGGPGGQRGFGGGSNNGIRELFSSMSDADFALRSDVKKELDLSDDQVSELEDLKDEAPSIRALMQDEGIQGFEVFRMSAEEVAPIRKKFDKQNKKALEEVLDVLKSKQKSRFEELKFQFAISRGNLVKALTNADVDVDDDEKEELEDARSKVDRELQKRIAEIRKELYVEALVDAGISESKIEKLMGDEFKFEATQGFGFGRGGGPPGGGGFGRGGGGDRGGRQRGGGDAGGGNRRRGVDEGGGNRRRGGDTEEDANPRRNRRPN